MAIYRLKTGSSGMLHQRPDPSLQQQLTFVTREMIGHLYESDAQGQKVLTVCFTGHRFIPQTKQGEIIRRLDAVLETLYQCGYRDFISGAAMGFDLLAAERVCHLRSCHGDVRLHIAIPCSNQVAKWPASTARQYERILYNADHVQVLSHVYYKGCMQQRNRYMVDRSTFCLCYLTHIKGGTMSTVAYAMQQSCPVMNVAMDDACEAFVRSGGLSARCCEAPPQPFPVQEE